MKLSRLRVWKSARFDPGFPWTRDFPQPPAGMPRSRKINLENVKASLDKTCPKCGFTITPDLVKRVDFERIECPKCGEKFQPQP